MKRTIQLAFLSVITITALASCNTTIGLGRDMRILGTEMERKAGGSTNNNYSGGAPVY